MSTERFKFRRDTELIWKTANPVLLAGEIAYTVTTSGAFAGAKFGDGKTAWQDLPYMDKKIALELFYNNTNSGLEAANAQEAIDELASKAISEAAISKLSAQSLRFDGILGKGSWDTFWQTDSNTLTEIPADTSFMFAQDFNCFAFVKNFVNGSPVSELVTLFLNFDIKSTGQRTAMYSYDKDAVKTFVLPSGETYTWNNDGTDLEVVSTNSGGGDSFTGSASDVTFNPAGTGLSSTNVQEAIDEVKNALDNAVIESGGKLPYQDVLLSKNIIPITGIYKNGVNANTRAVGEVYYNSSTNKLRRCTIYTGVLTSQFEDVDFTEGALYLNLTNSWLYQHNGDSMDPLHDYSVYFGSRRIFQLKGIGSMDAEALDNTSKQYQKVGDSYYDTVNKVIKVATNVDGPPSYIDTPCQYNAIYVYGTDIYIYGMEKI